MISTIIYIICLITIAALYFVSYKSAKNNFKADLDHMQEIYESHRESWIKEIEALKEDNDSLKVDNTVLQADNTSLKEAKKYLDAELSCLTKEKKDVEIELIEAKEKAAELEDKLCIETAWRVNITPDTSDRMLICSVTKKGEKRINIAWYEDGKWHGNGNLDNVIAWRPLPELPEFEDPAEGDAE